MKNLLTLLALTLSLTLVGCGSSAPGPGDTVKNLAYAMEDGDSETVKEIAPGLVSVMGAEKVDAMVAQSSAEIAKEGGIKSVTIDSEEIEGNTAKVKATLESAEGEKDTQDFTLTKVKDKWIIDMDMGDKGGPSTPDGDFDIDLDDKDAPDTE